MSDRLEDQLIRLGSQNLDLRKHLKPVLDSNSVTSQKQGAS